MDLREKPGKIQKALEFLLRVRLISVVLLVVFMVTFLASGWQQMNSLPLAASEALGMWLAGVDGATLSSGLYLAVAAASMIVLFFVFAGFRSGVAGIVALASFAGALWLLGGSEGMQLIFYAVFAVVALVLFVVAKWSVACVLFPFAMAWLLLTGFVVKFPLGIDNPALLWAVMSGAGFSCAVAFAMAAGKLLSEGTPQAGSLVKAGRKMVLPVSVSSLLAMTAMVVDMGTPNPTKVAGAIVLWVAFMAWFFIFLYGELAFAPWERLRSGSRRVQMKEKKKKEAKK